MICAHAQMYTIQNKQRYYQGIEHAGHMSKSGWPVRPYSTSGYSRQPRLGLATYSLFVSLVCLSVCLFVCLSVCPPVFLETARYTLTKLCVQVTYVVRQKPIDFGVN